MITWVVVTLGSAIAAAVVWMAGAAVVGWFLILRDRLRRVGRG